MAGRIVKLAAGGASRYVAPFGPGRCMIVFLTTPGYAKTHQALAAPDIGIDVQVMDYRQLLDAKTLPRATYVFTDLDRLPLYGLQLAAQSYRTMRQGGLTVLNDPARVLSRYGLLRRLH